MVDVFGRVDFVGAQPGHFPSSGLASLDFDARPAFDHLHDRGEVLVRADLLVHLEPQPVHRVCDPHRHTRLLGLFEAEPQVLAHQAGGEAVVERPGEDRVEIYLAMRCCAHCSR